jgi:hypothetical protein
MANASYNLQNASTNCPETPCNVTFSNVTSNGTGWSNYNLTYYTNQNGCGNSTAPNTTQLVPIQNNAGALWILSDIDYNMLIMWINSNGSLSFWLRFETATGEDQCLYILQSSSGPSGNAASYLLVNFMGLLLFLILAVMNYH